MVGARPFRAFVSYCHADSPFAAWLQRKLEFYRVPRRLAGQVEPLAGEAQGRVGPVFRDVADLSAAHDLSAAVREGIALSSTLIVVASPDAAKSRWVEREIELFRELHPEGPILVALIRGEPEEAMPAAILARGREPLAADFRPEVDGRRIAFLRLVAALLHLPFDALVQRDAQRRLRRVTAVTLAAVVLAVVMALLLLMALRARGQAERQRGAAEGVVEAMVTDVRKEARRTGHLKLRSAINGLALSYYAKQGNLNDLPDESVERRARVLHALGEDDVIQGNYEAASAKFNEAFRATARILAKRPDNGNAIFAHGQSVYWIGSAAFFSNDQRRALTHWQAYFELARKLQRVEPRSSRALLELGYAHGNLCDVNMRDQHDIASGLSHCRKALKYENAALARNPGSEEILRALANRHGWFGEALLGQKKFAEARAQREAEAAIVAKLLEANADDAELRDRAIWPQIGLAKIDIGEGELVRGIARYEECLRKLDQLSSEFRDNQLILGERVRVNVLLSAALRRAARKNWTTYRDRAGVLLYGQAYAHGENQRAPPGLERQHEMFRRLEEGK